MRGGLSQRVREAIGRIRREDLLPLLSRLIEIPSVSGFEADLAYFIKDLLDEWGVSARLDEVLPGRYNVIAELGGGDVSLLLNGHLDTATPDEWEEQPFRARIVGGRVYGLGAADMKGGLSAMLAAFREAIRFEGELEGEVILAFVVDEEEQGRGAQHLVDRGTVAHGAVVGEPTALRLCTSQMGYVDLTVMIYGKPAHGSFPERGINAVDGAIAFLSRFRESRLVRSGRILSMNVNRIVGGTRSVSVPGTCRIEMNLNLIGGVREEEVKEDAERILEELKAQGILTKYYVATSNYGDAFSVNENERIVTSLREAYKAVTGREIKKTNFAAWTDAETLFLKAGIPTVVFGPGDCAVAHTPYEYVDIAEVEIAARVYFLTIFKFLSQSSAQ